MKKYFFFHKQYLFGQLFSRNAKKTHTDQSYCKLFHSVQKEPSHKPLKVPDVKEVFPKCIYH